MKLKAIIAGAAVAMGVYANAAQAEAPEKEFNYVNDRFADIEVLRYKVPGFEELDRKSVV